MTICSCYYIKKNNSSTQTYFKNHSNNKFGIQKYIILKCQPSKALACSSSYTEAMQPFRFMVLYSDDSVTVDPAPKKPFKPCKVADVTEILDAIFKYWESTILF